MPEALHRRRILGSAPPPGIVLDPFDGTGATATAAKALRYADGQTPTWAGKAMDRLPGLEQPQRSAGRRLAVVAGAALHSRAGGGGSSAAGGVRPASRALHERGHGDAGARRREGDPAALGGRPPGTHDRRPLDHAQLPRDVDDAHHPGAHSAGNRRADRSRTGRPRTGLRSTVRRPGCGRPPCRTRRTRAAGRQGHERRVRGVSRGLSHDASADSRPRPAHAGARAHRRPPGHRGHARAPGPSAHARRPRPLSRAVLA
ncbi:DNA methyltransferase [Streptomyces fodineus]|uniref:DNA methyltransferase n=1 Tax=Streptomyces fodineus TaxID=1904616 RepID=UPI001D03C35A